MLHAATPVLISTSSSPTQPAFPSAAAFYCVSVFTSCTRNLRLFFSFAFAPLFTNKATERLGLDGTLKPSPSRVEGRPARRGRPGPHATHRHNNSSGFIGSCLTSFNAYPRPTPTSVATSSPCHALTPYPRNESRRRRCIRLSQQGLAGKDYGRPEPPPEEPFLPSTNLSGPRSGQPGGQQRPLSSAKGQRRPSRSPLGPLRAPIASVRRPGPAALPASAAAGKSRSATGKSTHTSRDAGAAPTGDRRPRKERGRRCAGGLQIPAHS